MSVNELKETIKETPKEKPKEKSKKVERVIPPHVDVKPDPVAPMKKKKGKTSGAVRNCNSLRLREGANIRSRELARLPVGTSVTVDLDNSTESFYEVSWKNENNVLLVGFCIKEFIEVG